MAHALSGVLRGCRVLLVEDEVMVAWLLEDMLSALGCDVVGPAARVNQALTMIKAGRIDAALLDVNLNGEKSYPVANALAACGVPFAFSSGYDKDSIQEDYRSLPLLQKPYEQSALGATLERLLESAGSAH